MEVDGPTLLSKVAIFLNLGQGLSKKYGCFFIFDPNLEDGFFRQNIGFLTVVFSQFCPNII